MVLFVLIKNSDLFLNKYKIDLLFQMFPRLLEQNGDILLFLNSQLCFNLFIFKFVKFKKNIKKNNKATSD